MRVTTKDKEFQINSKNYLENKKECILYVQALQECLMAHKMRFLLLIFFLFQHICISIAFPFIFASLYIYPGARNKWFQQNHPCEKYTNRWSQRSRNEIRFNFLVITRRVKYPETIISNKNRKYFSKFVANVKN